MNGNVRVFITGGTFDKVYDPIAEKLTFGKSSVPELLRLGNVTTKVEIEQLMLKDSLYMTEEDRRVILGKCQGSLEDRILITHGTSTMVETAKILGQDLKGKTAVLTGAMIPHYILGSDALFNFAFAYGSVLALPAGVYIAMNGRVFPWNNVRKDAETGEFKHKC